LAATEKDVLDESAVVSVSGYARVLGNDNFSYMGKD